MKDLVLSVALALAAGRAAAGGMPHVRKSDLPTSTQWVSLKEDVEFLPSDMYPLKNFGYPKANEFPNKKQRRRRNKDTQRGRKLDEEEEEEEEEEEVKEDNPQYSVQPFVEGVSDYDECAQAWRMLGFMIDCDDFSTDDDGSGSQDDDDTGEGCSRYVIWAAYVDLKYEGGGIGEYQYWDRVNQEWDTTPCNYDANGPFNRCAKMDCHLDDTHFSLLGFFKHKSYDDWMEQLFKHEGVCIWTDEEYAFMSAARETWPQGCVLSSSTDSDGNPIYYDIKPVNGGGITMALYTDTRCVEEYQSSGKNDPITIENVIGNVLEEGEASGSGDNYEREYSYETLEESLAAWDSAFNIFKTCQPCIAHDLNNVGYGYDDDSMKGSTYGTYTYGYDDDGNNYNNGGADFDCYDDADYTNVNQCMKFMAKTTMKTATFRDLAVASAQGTLVDTPMSGYLVTNKSRLGAGGTYFFLIMSVCLLLYAIVKFHRVRKEKNFAPNWNPKQPLIFA